MAVTVRALENFVGGDWVAATSDSVREIVSPVTGETIAEAPNASSEDIDRAVAAARAAQPKWAALSAWERAKVCHAIADLIDRAPRGVRARALDRTGQAVHGRSAARHRRDGGELPHRRRGREADGDRGDSVAGCQQADPHVQQAERRLRVHHAVELPHADPSRADRSGIAAGNTIVIKPSEWTPLAMANFMQIMADAGLPDGRRQRRLRRRRGRGEARHPSRNRLHRVHRARTRRRRRSCALPG